MQDSTCKAIRVVLPVAVQMEARLPHNTPRWEMLSQLIHEHLLSSVKSAKDFVTLIRRTADPSLKDELPALERLAGFLDHLDEAARQRFLSITLPGMLRCALRLPTLFSEPLSVLEAGKVRAPITVCAPALPQ